MDDWLHNLPLAYMAFLVTAAVFLVAAAIHVIVATLARGKRAPGFKAVSPGMLSPLGVLFGLFIAFTAAQVWNDNDRANAAVTREASGLNDVLLLMTSFPGDPEASMGATIRRYIETAIGEWPLMTRHAATLKTASPILAEALQMAVALMPESKGQETAQRTILASLENVSEARGQRIIASTSQVSAVKWASLLVQAIAMLIAIATVHSDDWRGSAIATGLFAAGVAVSVLLILAYDRPFSGDLAITPAPLLEVMGGQVR